MGDTQPATPKPGADIVMRGGISSGVVYPGVLVRLADHYRLCEIGGASAGAIAAGMAAAAQYGSGNGRPDAFSKVLAQIPAEVGGARADSGGTSFRRLFATHPDLAPLGDLLWCVLGPSGWKGWLWGRLGTALGGEMLTVALAGMALLLLFAHALFQGALALAPSGAAGLFLVLAALVALSAAVVPPALLLLADLLGLVLHSGLVGRLRANGFGLTNGVAPGLWEGASLPGRAAILARGALSDWMHLKIQEAAGLPLAEPLTMAHLWAGRPPPGVTAWDRRQIDLVLTTTNLSHQVPHRFPFLEKPGLRLYFRRDDLERVLPRPVVDSMVAATLRNGRAHWQSEDPARKGLVHTQVIRRAGVDYYRLPRPEQLPVLLGVRLSLSFPGLVSAVRLHAWRCDDTSDGGSGDRDADGLPVLRPCLFSDGGITSNFPITVFDEPLPRRPTFCINLADLGPADECGDGPDQRVVLDAIDDPARYQKIAPEWRVDPDGTGLRDFVTSIVDTARNAHENELMTAPVARARIVTIRLDPEREGGLNLDMDAATVERLAHYGAHAADRLIAAYLADQEATAAWRAHRTLRMRTTLAAVESFVTSYIGSWATADSTGLRYKETLAEVVAGLGADRPRFAATKRGRRLARLARLVAAAVSRPEDSLYDGCRNAGDRTSLNRLGQAPRPRMGLRLAPTGSQDPLRG